MHALGHARKTDVPPSPPEAKAAEIALRAALRPTVFGELGGTRPDPTNRMTSWWGGCMLGSADQSIPTGKSGAAMQPILQVRTDEVGMPIPGLGNIAILSIWIDLNGDFSDPKEGDDFVVLSATSLDGLVPIGRGYREDPAFPTFPIQWQPPVQQHPTWEDFALKVPSRVAWSDDSDWFFENPVNKAISELQSVYPIKLGGWPTWIQGSQWEGTQDQEDFVFQIDSCAKGGLGIGDSGSFYLFREKQNRKWHLRCDFF